MKKNENLWQAVKYTLFSVSAGAIQAGSFFLLYNLLFQEKESLYWTCHITALVLSVIWNFTLNRKFTFHAANNIPIAMLKVAGFYLVFTPVSAWLGQMLVDIGWNGLLVEFLTMCCNFVLEFLFMKFVVFRKQENARENAQNT